MEKTILDNSKNLTITQKPEIELTKFQKLFNTLVQKIETLKIEKIEVEKHLRQVSIRVMKDLVPLENKLVDRKVEFVFMLDHHYLNSYFKKKELEKLKYLICSESYALISQHGKDELKEVFERHNENETFDELTEEADGMLLDAMKRSYENMGFKFEEDADIDTLEKLKAYIEAKMDNKFENYSTKNHKKKTTKQTEKEAKLAEEAKNISKTARAIYTDLVKEFHPDKEQDELEKVKKNAIMHQITEAYQKNDLFKLLKLKLELLVGAKDNLILVDEQLKYYNKILKEQVNELEGEIWAIKEHPYFAKLGKSEKYMDMNFAKEMKLIKQNVRALENDLKLLPNEKNMRIFLRDFEINEDYY